MINILFLVYPTHIGIMSRLSGVKEGEFPFFEDAMSRSQSNPTWGVTTDDATIDKWLEGLRGRQNKLYLSVTFAGLEERPAWCRDRPWFDCLAELASKAERVVVIGQDRDAFLYDSIVAGMEPGNLAQIWHDSENTNNVMAGMIPGAVRLNLDQLTNKKGMEIIYRQTGARLRPLQIVKRVDPKVIDMCETLKFKATPVQEPPAQRREVQMEPAEVGPIPDDQSTIFLERFALCISAHPAYEKFLPELFAEWDRQIGDMPIRKVLLWDADIVFIPPDGWEVISGEEVYKEPAQLRNLALEMDVDWIQYWDADNKPDKNHIQIITRQAFFAHETVGCIYPDTIHQGHKISTPEDGDPRVGCYIDTASCWRKEAVLGVGGWQAGMNAEDWALGRDMWLAGWQLIPSGIPFKWQPTPGNRSEVKYGGQVVWEAKDFAIVILLRGDYGLLEKVKTSMTNLELPRHCGITLMCEGGEEFRDAVEEWINLDDRFERKTVVCNRPAPLPFGAADFMKIHARVGDLYGRAFRMTPEEAILTWEDDVQPEPGALRALSDQLGSYGDVAAVGAPYITRGSEDLAASWGKDWWDSPVKVSELKDKPMEVGMIAGGWTLWAKAALEDCPMLGPMGVLGREGFMGWDGFICKRINQNGWKIQLCPKSKVHHKPHE